MNKYNKDELERLIFKENLSYKEIGKKYGVSGNTIRKNAKKLGIVLPKRRNINPNETFNKGKQIHIANKKQNSNNSKLDLISDNDFIEIIKTKDNWKDILVSLGYNKHGSKFIRDKIRKRCSNLGINLNLKQNQLDTVPILSVTKGDLFKKRSNWQNARSNIQNSARKIFFKNCLDPKCIVCGYTNHVEVAHIKAVSNFSEDSLISEINDISNLIGLCPNYHWEYDNGLLDISKYINHENNKK